MRSLLQASAYVPAVYVCAPASYSHILRGTVTCGNRNSSAECRMSSFFFKLDQPANLTRRHVREVDLPHWARDTRSQRAAPSVEEAAVGMAELASCCSAAVSYSCVLIWTFEQHESIMKLNEHIKLFTGILPFSIYQKWMRMGMDERGVFIPHTTM